jgi:isopentenyl-diphosphate delta-isomerase
MPNKINRGIKNAAVRKLDQELGIKAEMVPKANMKFITRILYKADNDPKDPSNPWLEHELDHILAVKGVNVSAVINPNEVAAVRWVTREALRKEISQSPETFTPWFRLIEKHLLEGLWEDWKSNLATWHDNDGFKTINNLSEITDFTSAKYQESE